MFYAVPTARVSLHEVLYVLFFKPIFHQKLPSHWLPNGDEIDKKNMNLHGQSERHYRFAFDTFRRTQRNWLLVAVEYRLNSLLVILILNLKH